ncbi:hypothetical protein M1271_04135 [Patescibacteria group bacterium]|nr:hypothetical protein [Patescibacteria group bacterium]
MENFLTVLIPVTFIFGAYPIINNISLLKKLSTLKKLCLSLLATTSFTIIFLSFWGILFSRGFIAVSRLLFLLLVILTIVALRNLIMSEFSQKLVKTEVKKRIVKGSIVTHLLIILFVLIFLLIFAVRPVVDSDVVDSYLPLARSIIKIDRIPAYNYYDGSPFAIPPVGEPTLFAYYYAVSGNITGEVFRFINIPYFLGFLLLSYFIFNLFIQEEYSLLGVLVVLIIPFLEVFIFEAGFYPDFVFAFLAIFCFWFMLESFLDGKRQSWLMYFLLGLSLGASLLLKYQAVFIYSLVFGLGLFRYFQGKRKILYLSVPFIPFLLKIFFQGEPYAVPQGFASMIFLIILLFMALLSLRINVSGVTKDFSRLVVASVISLSGFIFTLRNYLYFGNFTSQKVSFNWASSVGESIGVATKGGIPFEVLTVIFGSSLAVFWLLPKIAGYTKGLFSRRKFLPLFILSVWYSWWVLFLGAADSKWLFPVIPFLALVIIDGLRKLFMNKRMVENIVYAGVFFHLLSSKFLLWNLWTYSLGSNTLRQSVQKYTGSKGITEMLAPQLKSHFWGIIKIPNHIIKIILRSLYILAARVPIHSTDIPLIIILTFVLSIGIVFVGLFSDKLKLRIVIPTLIVVAYGYVFIVVSGGLNLRNFAKKEQNLLFDYWGQSTNVVPYLLIHSHISDRIAVFSTPSGLSYYTGLQTYNMEYGGGLALFYPVFESENLSDIYRFYKKNHIRYVLVNTYGTSEAMFRRLKDKTKIFDILENKEYAKKVIRPNSNVYWEMYEII